MKRTLATSGSLARSCRPGSRRRRAVDHALIHADVQNVGSLLAGSRRRLSYLPSLTSSENWASRLRWSELTDHDVDVGRPAERGREPDKRKGSGFWPYALSRGLGFHYG